MTVWFISAQAAAAWVAAIAGGVALTVQLVNAIRKKAKEKDEIEEALDHQPMIKQQLELGNVGEAVKHLNAIIISQAQHIQQQDSRHATCEEKIERLTQRNEALELEAEGWERRAQDFERRVAELERNYEAALVRLARRGEQP